MSLNVLVVDDSAVMRAMIVKTLKLSGAPVGEVYQASNGEEGLRQLESNWIDLALVDINMPIMDGEQMIDRMREQPETADVRVIVVSTEGSDTRVASLRAKGAGFVHKPFTPEALRENIVKVTGVADGESDSGAAFGSGDFDF
jgi:two-component system, chemotaxis family, chemotaxis protein CheY